MKVVLVLVLLAVAGVAVYFAVQQSSADAAKEDEPINFNMEPEKKTSFDEWKAKMDAAGAVEPDGTPEFEVNIELKMKGKTPRLHFHVREVHGWAAAGIYVSFWHQTRDEEKQEWARDSNVITYLCKQQLYFNETLHEFTTPIPPEFPKLNGQWGTTENWGTEIRTPPAHMRMPTE